ncbi:LuxR family transcriptional regulator [Paraburkholderia sp. Ac-20340]|uniref:helix-turn-helix transcriptional regulator n=1 Tax=Paraburkholderia sp. Ac-20340 TaxID=2703888 RepID=UPI00198259E6|nr:LuxR family transcriptional regulator [Paraburkholderia sp. Ac-20340]MBN3856760.1 LuxR family transcriptional regulator [Paraburkholderia sp. Ac-20340]
MDLSVDDLLNATDELELAELVKRAIQTRGAESFVFVSLHPSDFSDSRSTYRFLIGCRPEWCQLYNANRWYLTDPCLEYARSNTAPLLGSELPVRTAGQRRMLEVAAEYGFRSGYVVPVHTSEKGRIGILYLGSDLPPETMEAKFHEARPLFRALALELLEWSSRAVREEVMQVTGLTHDELRLLGLVRTGFTAADIAAELQVSSVTVYRQFQRINEKLNVARITAAVKFAEEHDLLA